MKSLCRWLIVPALVVGAAYVLRAQEPGEPRKTGKILLFKTGQVMEGDIEQVGAQMCVRRGSSELWIAVEKTMRLSPDWQDAYGFMQTLIKADNVNERVLLARWCHTNRLYEEALQQARIALKIQPGNADAKIMVTALERAPKEPATKPVVQIPVPPTPRAVEPPPTVDVTAETMIAFTSRVQPILMNTCASCHSGNSGGKFHLERVFDSGSKSASQRNLAAVLSQIDLERPAISPLLVKAITPHGRDTTPPIKDRGAVPFQSMHQWLVDAIKKNPQLKDYHAATKGTPLKTPTETKKSSFSSQSLFAPIPGEDVSRPLPAVSVKSAPATPGLTPTHERDWCHADHFNERAHPHGMGQHASNGGR